VTTIDYRDSVLDEVRTIRRRSLWKIVVFWVWASIVTLLAVGAFAGELFQVGIIQRWWA